MGTGAFAPGSSSRSVIPTAYLRLEPRLRISAVTPLLILYSFILFTCSSKWKEVSLSAGQDILSFLCDQQVHCHIHNSPSPTPASPDNTTPHLHILHCHAVIFASYNSTAKMSQTRYPETSATNHPVRRRHIPHQRPHPAIL